MHFIKKSIHKWSWLLLVVFLISGVVYPVIGLTAIVCMLAPVGVAFFKGRVWCGFYCPRGSFLDGVVSKLSLKKRYPVLFRTTWFKWLMLIGLFTAFTIQLAVVGNDLIAIGNVFIRMVLITTIVALGLGMSFNHRTWCGVCPMGTLAKHISERARRRQGQSS